MKRRNLLKGAVLAGAAPAIAATRLYGTPASVDPRDYDGSERLNLSLARVGLTDEFAATAKRMATIWTNVIHVNGEARSFNRDPSGYLQKHGFDGSDQVLASDSLVTLKALASPSVRTALEAKDYPTAMATLRAMGALAPKENSALKARLRDAIQKKRDSLVEYLEERRLEIDPTSLSMLDGFGTLDDVAAIVAEAGIPQPLVALVPVVAIAGLLVAVVSYVVAAIEVAVAVDTASPVDSAGCIVNRPHSDDGSGRDQCSLFNGRLAYQDPDAAIGFSRLYRLASLTGDKQLALATAREAIEVEVGSFVAAMREEGLMNFPEAKLPVVVKLIATYSWKAAGLD
jgi:hypothetical protein